MTKRLLVVAGLLFVTIALLDLVLLQQLSSLSAAANQALASMAICQRFESTIRRYQKASNSTDPSTSAVEDVATYVETAVKAAGLPPESIIFIEPGPPHPVEGSTLLEQEIRVEADGCDLRKLGKFLLGLESGSASLTIRSLRISESRVSGSGELWRCDMTLTQTTLPTTRH